MAWSKTTPATTTKVKESPAIFQGNWAAIEDAFEEEHLDTSDGTPGQHRAGKCAVMMYGTQTQISAISSTTPCAVALDTDRLDLCYNNGTVWASAGGVIPVGTKMLFYQDTAPTGWTIQNTLNDKLVFVTKGSAAGGQTGGGAHSTGSWTITGFRGTTDSHTLTTAEMPAHTHTFPYEVGTTGNYGLAYAPATYDGSAPNVLSTGGGGGHTHTVSTGVTTDGTWRPAAYCCIICVKN